MRSVDKKKSYSQNKLLKLEKISFQIEAEHLRK